MEPNPELCKLIESKRPKDKVLNIGISGTAQEPLDFYIMEPHTLSTFSKTDAEALAKQAPYKIREVKKVPLMDYNQVVRQHFPKAPGLVSIDVEGLNEEIVMSIDLSSVRPNVFCIESTDFSTGEYSSKNDKIIRKFTDNDYFVYADTYLNTIFIDRKPWQ